MRRIFQAAVLLSILCLAVVIYIAVCDFILPGGFEQALQLDCEIRRKFFEVLGLL